LRAALAGHTVETAHERGWSTFTNGDLLAAAEASAFDVFITTDQHLPHQQRLAGRRIGIIVLPTTRWPQIERHVAAVVAAVASIEPGQYQELRW
jgi:hypothetical protein